MGLIFVLNVILIEFIIRKIGKGKEGNADGPKADVYKWVLISTVFFTIAWGSGEIILIPSILLYFAISQALVIGYKNSFKKNKEN